MCQMHLEKRFKLREMNVRHHTCNGNKNLHKLVLTATKGSATLYLAGQQAHLNQSYRLPSTLNSKTTIFAKHSYLSKKMSWFSGRLVFKSS